MPISVIRSGYTKLTPQDDDKLTEYLWPMVREIIKTAIENKQNLIVEGCYIPFDWANDFAKEYLDNIRYFCKAGREQRGCRRESIIHLQPKEKNTFPQH